MRVLESPMVDARRITVKHRRNTAPPGQIVCKTRELTAWSVKDRTSRRSVLLVTPYSEHAIRAGLEQFLSPPDPSRRLINEGGINAQRLDARTIASHNARIYSAALKKEGAREIERAEDCRLIRIRELSRLRSSAQPLITNSKLRLEGAATQVRDLGLLVWRQDMTSWV
jgi:hypothetical protein